MKHVLVLLFLTSTLISPANAVEQTAPHWQLLKDKSTIEWSVSYGKEKVTGQLNDFTAEIVFAPTLLEKSHALVKVNTGKVISADHDASENLPKPEWFAASEFPIASFETNGFKAMDKDHFEATGTLALRGKSLSVTLPFSVQFFDANETSPPTHYVRMVGQTTLKRLDFGVGQGDWSNTDTIGNDVTVSIRLEARMVP